MLRFRVLGASFSSFGCFVFEIWVLRALVFVFECFVFETTVESSASFSKLPDFNMTCMWTFHTNSLLHGYLFLMHVHK